MKLKNIIIAVLGLGLCLQARAENLSTTDGITYNDIKSQRTDPDGLYIEYTLPGGGLGMAKVKFSRLSQDQQKQYGYDAAKAKDYEARVAKANEDFRQESIRWDQTAQAQRAARQAQDLEMEKIINDRVIAMTQLNQGQAGPANNLGGGDYGWSTGGGLIGIPVSGQVPRAKTEFAPVVTPVPFPRLNIPHNTAPHPSR
ncbi:MAG: hypothetical protein JWQ04_1147 [Pedosphaera sp.]|nr:hypothetical protein [Pedosphaera sp.]